MKQINNIINDLLRVSLLISLLVFLNMTTIASYIIKPHPILLENYSIFLVTVVACTTVAIILLAKKINILAEHYHNDLPKMFSENPDIVGGSEKLAVFKNKINRIKTEVDLVRSAWLFNLATLSLSSIIFVSFLLNVLVELVNETCTLLRRTNCIYFCTTAKTKDITIAYISFGLLLPVLLAAKMKCLEKAMRKIELTITENSNSAE